MKTLAGIIITFVISGIVTLGLLTMWNVDFSPFTWELFWRISKTCGIIWFFLLALWILYTVFFKREKYVKSRGNNAHPIK